jgi:hypothetical protein
MLTNLNQSKIMKKAIFLLRRIILGVTKGLSTSNLPEAILIFHLNPIIRVLRFIFGFSTLALLTGKLAIFPFFITVIPTIFTIIHFTYFLFISFSKIKYMNTVLKSDKFDIKN